MLRVLHFLMVMTFFLFSSRGAAWNVDQLFLDFQNQGNKVLSQEQCKRSSIEVDFENPSLPRFSIMQRQEEESQSIGEWTPNGLNRFETSLSCLPEKLERHLLSTNNHAEFSEKARFHFKTCQSEWESNWPGPTQGLLQLVSSRYDICSHPGVRKIHFKIAPFYKLRGYLGLKPGSTKKPLLILKCGAYCDSGDGTTRGLMTQTFDTAPFHVLLLGNFTGNEFIADNERIGIGGFEEGTLMIRISKWLKTGPLAKVISSVHLAGFSLGGHTSLFTSLFNEYNLVQSGDRAFDSIFAICPVVDLRSSLNHLFQTTVNGSVMRRVFKHFLSEIGPIFPDVIPIFTNQDGKVLATSELPSRIAVAAADFLKDKTKLWSMEPYRSPKINDGDQLLDYNNFEKDALKVKSTPVLVSGNRDDWFVLFKDNTQKLVDLLSENPGVSSIEMLNVDKGNHCALNVGYGWKTVSSLMRSFVLRNSPELLRNYRDYSSSLKYFKKSRNYHLNPGEIFISGRWEIQPMSAKATLYLKLLDRTRRGCQEEGRRSTKKRCFRQTWAQISNRDLPRPIRAPARNLAEAQEKTRWANSNIILANDYGEWAYSTTDLPSTIQWRTLGD